MVLGALLERAPNGFEQVDGAGWSEWALYGEPGELPEMADGTGELAGARVDIRREEVPDDWAERWKRFHHPVQVAGRLWIRPPWESPAVRPGVVEIVIEPGRAFGTGSHATTQGCLELLLDAAREPGLVERGLVDLGSGSGVLAIAAAKLGFAPVQALDCDRLALEATRANARDNGVELAIGLIDLRREPPPAAGTVVANLMRPLLLDVARRMEHAPRVLVVSGLLDSEADEVAAAFGPLEERRRVSSAGWSSLLLARPG